MSSSFIRTPTAAATSASPVLRKVTSFLSRVSRDRNEVTFLSTGEADVVSIQSVSGRSWENFWKRSPGPSFQQD